MNLSGHGEDSEVKDGRLEVYELINTKSLEIHGDDTILAKENGDDTILV